MSVSATTMKRRWPVGLVVYVLVGWLIALDFAVTNERRCPNETWAEQTRISAMIVMAWAPVIAVRPFLKASPYFCFDGSEPKP